MDPWCSVQSIDGSAVIHNNKLEFEDKFVKSFSESKEITFEKLPDSAEYLQSLENKLQKLKTSRCSGVQKGSEFKDSLVNEVSKVRQVALEHFISAECENSVEELDFSTDIEVHPFVRRLNPEQAINTGEQVVLTKADLLDKEQLNDSETSPKY